GSALVLFTSRETDLTATERETLTELGVADWVLLPQEETAAGDRSGELEFALADILEEADPTAIVLGSADKRVRAGSSRVADSMGVPVFLTGQARSSDDNARAMTVDVAAFLGTKQRAVAAFGERWQVEGEVVRLGDGTLLALTGTETYSRSTAPSGTTADIPLAASTRLITAGVGLAAGALIGVLGTVAHQSTLAIGEAVLPAGLILALAAAAALLVGLRLVLHDRFIVLACAMGMLGVIFLLSLRSVGGSVLIPEGLPGLAWTTVPTLVAALVVAWPRLPARG
ncbi:MAG: hypothetical protein JWQ68_391, partial [Cryobacterium sp.]|nr:hypothetical protein [Cryobacterium sp.]